MQHPRHGQVCRGGPGWRDPARLRAHDRVAQPGALAAPGGAFNSADACKLTPSYMCTGGFCNRPFLQVTAGCQRAARSAGPRLTPRTLHAAAALPRRAAAPPQPRTRAAGVGGARGGAAGGRRHGPGRARRSTLASCWAWPTRCPTCWAATATGRAARPAYLSQVAQVAIVCAGTGSMPVIPCVCARVRAAGWQVLLRAQLLLLPCSLRRRAVVASSLWLPAAIRGAVRACDGSAERRSARHAACAGVQVCAVRARGGGAAVPDQARTGEQHRAGRRRAGEGARGRRARPPYAPQRGPQDLGARVPEGRRLPAGRTDTCGHEQGFQLRARLLAGGLQACMLCGIGFQVFLLR